MLVEIGEGVLVDPEEVRMVVQMRESVQVYFKDDSDIFIYHTTTSDVLKSVNGALKEIERNR